MSDSEGVVEFRPSWWNFVGYLAFAWLIVPWVVAWFKRASVRLRLYPRRVVVERGILSKETKEVFVSDVRTVDTQQGFLQRIFGIGDLKIATAGTSGYEDVIEGLPKPKELKRKIMDRRRDEGGSRD